MFRQPAGYFCKWNLIIMKMSGHWGTGTQRNKRSWFDWILSSHLTTPPNDALITTQHFLSLHCSFPDYGLHCCHKKIFKKKRCVSLLSFAFVLHSNLKNNASELHEYSYLTLPSVRTKAKSLIWHYTAHVSTGKRSFSSWIFHLFSLCHP